MVLQANVSFICIAVRVRPVHRSVRTFARRVELYLGRLFCTHCMRLTLFTCIVYVQLVPEFCITLPVLKHCFFIIIWCCCYTVIYVNTCQCCLFNFVCCQRYAKCVPREPISRSSASQTADGILRCGLSVSILRFPLCGVQPRGLKWKSVCWFKRRGKRTHMAYGIPGNMRLVFLDRKDF